MLLDYARTVALVTGGNRGLGRAFVDELLHRGATVDVAVLAERVPGLNLLINKAGIHKPTNVLNPGAARITAEVLAVKRSESSRSRPRSSGCSFRVVGRCSTCSPRDPGSAATRL
jgi:short-subunit dehydrogenase involved in D-alanine esterification of teichoic acids